MMLRPLGTGRFVAAGLSVAAVLSVHAYAAGDLPTISYEKFVLPNGLTVVMSVDKTAPVVATFVHYHVGSKNERADRTGFAHFFEHLMFEGTENIERHSLDKMVQTAGGWLNAFTSFDETGYRIKLPSNQLKLALWIESERMLHARVEEIGVETQRGVVKEERNVRYDNTPYGSILENLAKYVGAGTPYAWTPIGSAQYIDQAKIEEFRDFYKQYYVPNNAVLAVVGDIDPVATRKIIEEYFADIPKGAPIERPKFELAPGAAEQSVEIREEKTPLPALIYGYRSVGRGHPDSYALDMLTTILATGNSSRMYRQMVDEKRLAVGVQAFPLSLENGGIVGLFAVSHPTVTMDQLGREFDEIIADVQSEGVTEEEFQKARNQMETQYAQSFTDVMDKAQALASYETFFNDPGRINTEIDRTMAVTRDDIQRVARKYLVPTNRVVLKYLPPAQGGGN
jgi:predicted Zn-dependent peptidase